MSSRARAHKETLSRDPGGPSGRLAPFCAVAPLPRALCDLCAPLFTPAFSVASPSYRVLCPHTRSSTKIPRTSRHCLRPAHEPQRCEPRDRRGAACDSMCGTRRCPRWGFRVVRTAGPLQDRIAATFTSPTSPHRLRVLRQRRSCGVLCRSRGRGPHQRT